MEDIAEQVNFSPYEFCWAFSFISGMTLNTYLAVVKAFPVEIINDDINHDISDFWGECWDRNRIEPLRALIGGVKGKLYGLCAPLKENETSFEYGIEVLLDHDAKVDDASLPSGVYRVWETDACPVLV